MPLLRVQDLAVVFGRRTALRDINFELFAGETLGLVGESGSGKSTLARAVLRLVRPARGRVEFLEQNLLACSPLQMHNIRRDLQIVFQDPLASLNPRMTVGDAIEEPLKIFEPALDAGARTHRVGAMLERVGLAAGMADRYPHEFSGGQCQRIGIARAMILNPKLLICDEPVSALDVSIQGQIVNLLLDLQRDAGMAMLFISHNLAVVKHLSHRVLVIYRGRIVEAASSDRLFDCPAHPYTRALLAAVPALPGADRARGTAPELLETGPPPNIGCGFRHRCPFAVAVCASDVPPLIQIEPGHWAACHLAHELMAKTAILEL
ncbi:MAG TPA: oligopeptide/dipeptide ABC transporter ATP-binding protein [Steroidobacteraceae bacterium]